MLVLMVGSNPNVDATVEELRRYDLVPVVATSDRMATRMLSAPDLGLAILLGPEGAAEPILSRLAARSVPAVIATGPAERDAIGRRHLSAIVLPGDASPHEIASAVVALLPRRRRLDDPAVIECGSLTVDLEHQRVSQNGSPIDVPPKEFQILRELLLESGRPVPSEELLRRIWPDHAAVTPDDVHRHVYRLRALIGDDRSAPLIVNRRGFGYAITQPVRAHADGKRESAGGRLPAGFAALVALRRRAARIRGRIASMPSAMPVMELGNLAVAAALTMGAWTGADAPHHAVAPGVDTVATASSAGETAAAAGRDARAGALGHTARVTAAISAGSVGAGGSAHVGRDGFFLGLQHEHTVSAQGKSATVRGRPMWVRCDPTSNVYTTACDAYDTASPALYEAEDAMDAMGRDATT